MSFMDAKFSKWGEVATAVLSQSLAKRFARVMLAAVLAASFLPVAAFADEGGAVGNSVGNEAVDQPAASDQPAATEPEAPAESEAQPAATELEAFADQPAATKQKASDVQPASGGDSELKGIKGKKDPIFWYEITSYKNLTERSSYVWSWEKDGETGAITVTETDDPSRVTVTGTEIGSVILKVSGGDLGEETIRIEIRKRTVGLSSSYGEKIYDGTPLTVVGINEDGEGWIDADKGRVKYKMTGSQTNAGESDNTFDVEFPSGSEEYFKEHYAITISYATLNVAQRPVTLTSASGSKEYDGKPLVNDKVTVGGDGWADGEGATYSFTGSQKIVGSSENAFECIPDEGTNLGNYQITKQYGTLTVTDRAEAERYQITLTPNSASVTYDGTEKSVSGFESLEFEVDGSAYTVSGLTAGATGTDAGEYPVEVTGDVVVTDSDGNDVTSQFAVTTEVGALTIAPRPVTLTSASDSKQYDTKPLTNWNVAVGGDGFADGEGATYSFTGSQTVPGTSDNSFEYELEEGTSEGNYVISVEFGVLDVTDRAEAERYQITLTPNSASVTYDGTEKSVSGFESLEFEVDGSAYTVSGLTAGATGTDAGEYPVEVTGQAVVTDPDGNDVTRQFNVDVADAKLTIVKADPDTPVDPGKPAPELPDTGDSTAPHVPYAMGVCGAAMVAAGAAAFAARRKLGSGE